jgi:hypothetical protein
MRILLCAAALSAGALATGCVSASTSDVPRVQRELASERYTELVAELGPVNAAEGALTVHVQQAFDRTYDLTTVTDRQVHYAHRSLAAAAVQSQSSSAGRALMVPVAIVASGFDLVLWVLTAPVAYPAGAIMGIDPGPAASQVTESERFAPESGTVVRVRVGEGQAAREVGATVGDRGRIRVVIDRDAEPALAAGRSGLALQFRLEMSGEVTVTETVGLRALIAIVESRVRGDLEERHFRWRRIHDAIPADAPDAVAVKAALMRKIAPLEKALR